MVNQTADRHPPIFETAGNMGGIIGRPRIERAVGAKHRGDVGTAIFRRQRMGPGEDVLGRPAEIFHLAQQSGEPGLLRQVVTAAQQQSGRAGQGPAEECAAVTHAMPSLMGRSGSRRRSVLMAYQPVIIERRLFQVPDSTTMAIWITKKARKEKAQRK